MEQAASLPPTSKATRRCAGARRGDHAILNTLHKAMATLG